MKYNIYTKGVFLLILLYSNCISEFDPPSQGYENLLVVEAFLSDSDEPFQVNLSRSTPIDTTAFIPETGASIILLSESGEGYSLQEKEPGIYLSDLSINPMPGIGYKLNIITSRSDTYESDLVVMRETPEIDSVTFEYEERPTFGNVGVQIYVNTHDPSNNTRYYRWDWDETWTFYTPFWSSVFWEDGVIQYQTENINFCWLFDESTKIVISTTSNLTQDVVSEFPLLYVSNDTDRLKNKYSLNVRQYSLSEKSYNYWNEIQKSTESLGTLFDPQPSTVLGNIYNLNDPDEIVLGYFDAATVTEKRIFISVRDLPPTIFPNYYQYCMDSLVGVRQVEEMIQSGYTLYAEEPNMFGGVDYRMANAPGCVDCTLRGTNIRPEYWQ